MECLLCNATGRVCDNIPNLTKMDPTRNLRGLLPRSGMILYLNCASHGPSKRAEHAVNKESLALCCGTVSGIPRERCQSCCSAGPWHFPLPGVKQSLIQRAGAHWKHGRSSGS